MLSQQLEQIKPKQLYKLLTAVSRDRLRPIRSFIDDILAEQIALIDLADVDQVNDQAHESEGYYELKTINGYGPYIYRRYRQNGRLKSEYIGKAKAKKGG